MAEIKHRVGIRANAAEVYQRLTTDQGLSTWWTTDTHGAGEPGSIIRFRFGDDGPDFEVVELILDRLVRWRHSGKMPEDWMGTEICFELSEDDKQTIVLFSHYNWQQADDFLAHCSTKWATFLMSLKASIEIGCGNPFPDDIHIDLDE
ncbi:MAG: SRPBCC domain-containing protein [Gammaproteobacteria bacterium]|nr:SRPBCC domain-containing protein [Gammaproteobacteria bacterium]